MKPEEVRDMASLWELIQARGGAVKVCRNAGVSLRALHYWREGRAADFAVFKSLCEHLGVDPMQVSDALVRVDVEIGSLAKTVWERVRNDSRAPSME